MKKVQIDVHPFPSTDTLLCPICNEAYLHHDTVYVYDRVEDSNITSITEVSCAGATEVRSYLAQNAKSGNPSSRRNGIAISFLCEHCNDWENPHDRVRLTIAQHKGLTLIEWDTNKMPRTPVKVAASKHDGTEAAAAAMAKELSLWK